MRSGVNSNVKVKFVTFHSFFSSFSSCASIHRCAPRKMLFVFRLFRAIWFFCIHCVHPVPCAVHLFPFATCTRSGSIDIVGPISKWTLSSCDLYSFVLAPNPPVVRYSYCKISLICIDDIEWEESVRLRNLHRTRYRCDIWYAWSHSNERGKRLLFITHSTLQIDWFGLGWIGWSSKQSRFVRQMFWKNSAAQPLEANIGRLVPHQLKRFFLFSFPKFVCVTMQCLLHFWPT